MYCMEYVKEPGYCSCCLTCAREEGERCGVNTAPCMKGLECSPIMAKDPQSTWNDFMLDHAVCLPKKPKGKCHGVGHWGIRKFFVWKRDHVQGGHFLFQNVNVRG